MARPQDLHAGPPCPDEGANHKLYVTGSGRLWCPVTQSIFGPSKYDEAVRGFVAGPLLRIGDRSHAQGGDSAPIFAAEALHGAA